MPEKHVGPTKGGRMLGGAGGLGGMTEREYGGAKEGWGRRWEGCGGRIKQ